MADNNDILRAIESLRSDMVTIKSDMVTKRDLKLAGSSIRRHTTKQTKWYVNHLIEYVDRFIIDTKARLERLEEHSGINKN